MRRLTFVLTIGVAVVLAVALLTAATQNRVPKYDAAGALVDSTISEVNGKVGIGTVNPSAKLQVVGSAITSAWDSYGELTVIHNQPTVPANSQEMFGGIFIGRDKATALAAGDALGGINFGGGPDVNEVRAGYAAIGALRGSPGNTGVLTFSTAGTPNTPAERMRIDHAGNVGIGTISPTSKLHIAGDIKVDGNIAAKYQDVAEWVDAREPLQAGTVVVLGSSRSDVERSTTGYDHAIAGVVSPKPGIVLGEGGRGKVLVAHSGRVRVKVDAAYGAIRRGDLLVTSPTAGHAMKSRPAQIEGRDFHRPGTILGEAIEPLSTGQGEILVLLTLQ
ncbi:MAG TPA: hypothetical protein VJM31_09650 [Vicinamibacterales bacterium]|nr:hypothetical protein [Vicinamibacterales bacterium]